MNDSIAIPALAAFFVTLILGPGLIRFLHRLKFGQFIREEGPESHLKKSGTPTMGGILFLVGILAGSVFYIADYPKIVPVLFVTLGVALTAVGLYEPLVKFAGSGAATPLTGFGYSLAKGVAEAVAADGLLGVFTGGVTGAAGGIAAAVVFGCLFALLARPRPKG